MKRLTLTIILLFLCSFCASAQTRPSILQITPITSVPELRTAIPSLTGAYVVTITGSVTANDAGGGIFIWDATNTHFRTKYLHKSTIT